MAKLPRVTNKRFGSDIELDNIGQFGSAAAGEKTNTKDVAEIQALEAWKQGWTKATMSQNKYPTMQERNGLDYVHAYQIDYLLREGIAEYDSQTEYNTNSIVKGIVKNEMKLFSSVLDQNIGQDLTNENAWKELSFGGGGLEIGDIGVAPLGIDETKGKRRYLNGQVIIQDQYVQFTNKVKSAVALYPSLACTESEWQATALLTVGGQVGKFVVDDEGGTIRLPKIIMPIQGLTDLSKLAEIVEAGLPDHTHTYTFKMSEDAGGSGRVTYGSNTPGANQTLTTNGVNNNSIYGNSDTVQQEQIQYPYFIQVATGAEVEDNIINEIELNNPFSLLDYKYSEYELNNISWLRSNGQYNSKAVYPAVYELLLKIYNGTETKAGVSVKLSTEAFTDYDFVLNTAEETFRLPVKTLMKFVDYDYNNSIIVTLNSTTSYTAVEDGIIFGYTFTNGETGAYVYLNDKVISREEGDFASFQIPVSKGDIVTTTGKSSEVSFAPITSTTNLYFYVGETVQNANLINAGRIEEKITEALAKPHIVETYVNGTSWYRIYSDGWCEQGGRTTFKTEGVVTVTLPKKMRDANYSCQITLFGDTGAYNNNIYGIYYTVWSLTPTSFKHQRYSAQTIQHMWRVSGYIA